MRDQILLTGPGSSAYRDEPTLVALFAVAQPQWLLRPRAEAAAVGGAHPGGLPRRSRAEALPDAAAYPHLAAALLESEGVTQSFGINCTVGAYEICDHPDLRKPRTAPATHPDKHVYHTFCNDACARTSRRLARAHRHAVQGDQRARKEYRDSEGNVVGDQPSCLGTWRQTTQHAAAKLRDDCRGTESSTTRPKPPRSAATPRAAPVASSTWRPHPRSRFCIIAQGDPGNTAKVMETVALGGAGGRLHTAVRALHGEQPGQRPPVEQDFVRDLPHVRWLDYCEIAYFVSHHAARTNMSRVVEILADVTAEQAEAKFRALRAVRPAFVYRRNSSFERPSAAEFLLSDARHMARRARAQPGRPAFEVAGGAHARCTIAMRMACSASGVRDTVT